MLIRPPHMIMVFITNVFTFYLLGNFALLCRLLFLSKSTFSKNPFRYIFRVSHSLDLNQAQHFVGPDLDPNCLQRLSADDTSR